MNVTIRSTPDMPFYTKLTDYEGIPIRSSAVVSDKSLREAWLRLEIMLSKMPDALANLVAEGAELHIIGKKQSTSDLPEHQHWKGKIFEGSMTIDERTRGVGGLFASCGEENLLKLRDDRYFGRDICLHEFAHTLWEFGLDDVVRAKIDRQFHLSLADRRWKTTYAATNESEFFAELTMWYFGTRGDYGRISPEPSPGKEWFQQYDPDAYQLLENIYSGKLVPERLELEKVTSTADEGAIRSLTYDRPTTLRFVNQTSESVKLFWLDYDGKRIERGEIAAHSRASQNCHATHPFVLTDENDRMLAIFVATEKPGIAYISSQK